MKKGLNDRPPGCECDDTHEKNKTVCIECWAAGYRFNSPYYPRVWWNPIKPITEESINEENENPV